MHKSTNLPIIRKEYKLFFVIFLTNTKKRGLKIALFYRC